MKYRFEIDIRLDQYKLFDLSLDRQSLLLWDSGYSDVELVSGVPDFRGVKYKLTMGRGNTTQTVDEIITFIDRPDEYHAEYSYGTFRFSSKTQFIKIDEHITKCVSKLEGGSSSPVLNFFFLLGTLPFKWQAKKALNRFREFAERHHTS